MVPVINKENLIKNHKWIKNTINIHLCFDEADIVLPKAVSDMLKNK